MPKLDMNGPSMPLNIISPRDPYPECFSFENGRLNIRGTVTGSATVQGRSGESDSRNSGFRFRPVSLLRVKTPEDEAGLAIRCSDDHHFSLFVSVRDGKQAVVLRKRAADIESEEIRYIAPENVRDAILLRVDGEKEKYHFYWNEEKRQRRK